MEGTNRAPWCSSFFPAPPLLTLGHCLHLLPTLQVAVCCGGVKPMLPSPSTTQVLLGVLQV